LPRPRLVSIPCREAGVASWEAPQPRGGGGGDEVRGEHGEEPTKHVAKVVGGNLVHGRDGELGGERGQQGRVEAGVEGARTRCGGAR